MPMNNRLLRPLLAVLSAIAGLLITDLSGDTITDAAGDPLRTIQDA